MAITKSLHNFSFGISTHIGHVRITNEDFSGNFETKNGYVFLVCDGMGGHLGGAKASKIAVDAIKKCLQSFDYKTPFEALSQSIITANETILEYAEKNPGITGMGTTCAAILIIGSDVYYAHVGDSRIYLFSNQKLIRVTKDHSVIQKMIDLGQLTEEEAAKHPRKDEISNALGRKEMKPPTVCKVPVQAAKGDVFLICSDGLTSMVKDAEIETVLKNSLEMQDKANLLIDMANKAGGIDNITVQLVEINQSNYAETITNIPVAPVKLSRPPQLPKPVQPEASNIQYKNIINKYRNIIILASIALLLVFGSIYFFKEVYSPEQEIPVIDTIQTPVDTVKMDTVTKVVENANIDSTIQQEMINDSAAVIAAKRIAYKAYKAQKAQQKTADSLKAVSIKATSIKAASIKDTAQIK